jgi:uncharacterized protein YukE
VALTERLAFLVTLNSAQAVKGFQSIGDAAEKELGKAEFESKKLQSSLNKFGAVAVGASVIAGRALLGLAKDASDLEETLNKSAITFGDAAGEVEAFGESSASALGQSKRDAIEAASSFGALFRTLGYTEDQAASAGIKLTKLASDLASFSNTSPDEAVLALGAALRGEAEPIRRYNILLNDQVLKARAATLGLGEFTGTLPPAVRAQAAYAEILSQSSLQQGDFARTAGGAANQQRILSAQIKDLRANIGQGALPALTSMTGGLNALLGAFTELPDEVQTAVGTVATFATATAGIAGVGSLATSQVLKLKDALKVTEGATGIFGTSLSAGGVAGLGAAVGLGALTAALGAYKAAQAKANAEATAWASVLEVTGGALTQSEEGVAALRESFKPLAGVFAEAGVSFEEFAAAAGAIDQEAGDASDALAQIQKASREAGQDTEYFKNLQRDLAAEIRAGGGPRNELIAQLIESGAAGRQVGQDLDSLFDRIDEGDAQYKALISTGAVAAETSADQTAATKNLTAATTDSAKAAYDLAVGTEEVVEARQKLLDSTLGLFDAEIEYQRSNMALTDGLQDVGDALVAVGDARKTTDPTDDIAAEKELAEAYLDTRSNALGVAKAAVEYAASQRGLTVEQLGAAEANRIQIAELGRIRDTLAPGSDLRKQLDAYIAKLNELDRTFVTEFKYTFGLSNQSLQADAKRYELQGLRSSMSAASTSGVASSSGVNLVVNVNAGAVLSDPLTLGRAVENALNVVGRVNGGVRIPIAS